MAPLVYELTSQFLQDKGSRSESVSVSVYKVWSVWLTATGLTYMYNPDLQMKMEYCCGYSDSSGIRWLVKNCRLGLLRREFVLGYLDEIINSIKSHYVYILGMAGFVVLSEISQRVGQDGIDRCALNR
ncbi:hypothetical protein RRG08_059714 [Elysia crispata]|uniref:Uncharacterized protein n=1 Tax=Elysia crispata TaxID=231223 RepID=A0AAE0YI44_9GAST|nr:hypothetical protein RRG08_059714 [Elysia crispata]